MYHPRAVTLKVNGQLYNIMSSFWRVFANNSIKKSRRNTKIGRKVFRTTADIPHQFQGQRFKGQGHQVA